MLTNKMKYFILFNIVIWMFFGVILFIGVMPETPLMINKDIKTQISIVFPNRWPFFTKNPREDYIYVFRKSSNGYEYHQNFPNSSFSNAFGLVNYQRAVGMEYGIITSKIDDDLWNINNNGKNLFDVFNNDTIKSLQIKKTKQITRLIGEFIFVKIEPLPYLWRNKVNQFDMPSKFVKIKIQ